MVIRECSTQRFSKSRHLPNSASHFIVYVNSIRATANPEARHSSVLKRRCCSDEGQDYATQTILANQSPILGSTLLPTGAALTSDATDTKK